MNNNDINQMTAGKMTYNPLASDAGMGMGMGAMSAHGPNINPSSPLSPSIPSYPVAPIYPPIQQGGPTVTDADYIPGFLASMIGRNVRAEFLLGTSQYVDKTGILVEVGVNFFVLQDVNSRTNTMCDLYSVKFVTILY